MKLSEAIRLGAMLKPQARGSIHSGVTSCALGAAADALGMANGVQRYAALRLVYPYLSEPATCEACGRHLVRDTLQLIYHRNDIHGWSRDHIADWVETLEAAQEIAQPASVAAVARIDHDQLVPTPRA